MIDLLWDMIWAARINVYFALLSIPLGFVLAIAIGIGMTRERGFVHYLSSAYVYFFRGTPLFIQFFFFYFLLRASGLHRYRWTNETLSISWPWQIDLITQNAKIFSFLLDALYLGPLVLLLNTAAYSAVIFANARRAVPKGDLEAADAYGFSPRKKFWRVTWPSMIRIAWPAYTNEVVFLFLSTTLVYQAIPSIKRAGGQEMKDLFLVAQDYQEQTFNPFAAFLPAMALFIIMTLVIFFIFGLVNKRLNRHMVDRSQIQRPRFRPNFIR